MKLCLVLGAGASKPYGYPLGFELKQRIIQYCISEPRECAMENDLDKTWGYLKDVAQRLDSSPAQTIDRFLEEFRLVVAGHDYELGQHARMAVAAVLFRHEYKHQIIDEWYNNLARYLASRPTVSTPLNIVTFNYDRSLEYFVPKILSGAGGQPRNMSDVERFRCYINLQHIYGSLSPLPGFQSSSSDEVFEYGKFTGYSAWKAGREIFKFVHDEANPETVSTCRSSVRDSDVILILGFGFDHLNMTRLGLHEGNENQLIISSGYKLDREAKQRVRATCIPKRIHFGQEDATVLGFLRETRILEPENYEQTNDEVWTRLGSGA